MLTPRSSLSSLAFASLLATFALACGKGKGHGEGVGSISLPLQATAASGNVYQLRSASFRITGPTSITLTTAGTPDSSPALLATLQTGGYSAELLAGWSLVRIAATGVAEPVQAQLVSANPATFAVASQQQTTVGFAFDSLGDVVDTSQGTARIVITVNERDAGANGGPDAGPTCRAINEQCGFSSDCCSNVCVNGRCTDGVCSGLDGPCGRSGGTCCAGGFCVLNGGPTGDACLACRALTQTCSANEQCCSNSCVNGRCTDGSCSQVDGPCGRSGGTCCAGAFCALNGGATGDACLACRALTQTCSANEQCCSNSCVNGRCTDGSCSQVDGPCGRSGGTCCAGAFCALNGGPTGDACLACRALTQTCSANEQCCSNSCVNGRCTDGSCSQVDGPCGRSGGTCCAGAFCALNGGATGDTCLACRALTQTCSANEQCCSNSCVNGRCTDGSCSQVDGPCGRSGGTCCAGAFCALNGGPTGDACLACRALTQTCSANEQCCSNSCVNGRCTDGSCSQVDGPCGRSGGTCCAGAFCALNGGATGDTCLACRALTQTCSANEQCCSNSCVGGRCTPATLAVPTFVGAGAGAEGTGDLTVPYPASITAGQLLILQVGSRSSNVPVTPAGWTLLHFDEHGNARQRLYYKVAAAADTGTLAVAAGASNVNGARMYAFSGVVPVSSFSEGAATGFDDDGTLPGPTVVTTGSGRLGVAFVVLDSNPAMAPFVGETGGDWNEPVPEFGSAIGSNLSLQLQTAPLPSAGTISGGEASFGGASDSSICRAFALIGT